MKHEPTKLTAAEFVRRAEEQVEKLAALSAKAKLICAEFVCLKERTDALNAEIDEEGRITAELEVLIENLNSARIGGGE